MKKLKIGVFGGARGMVMIDVLLHHPDAELVAVCDKYPPILDSVKKKADELNINVSCYESFDDFIEHDMDAVVLANYATEHAPFAIRCLKAGKHVMSEVLPSTTMAQAVELIEAVEESGLVYAYAENYCYRDDTFEMWRRCKNGDIGEFQYAEASYKHDCSGGWLGITYGERDHWRNHLIPTFYCTHSLGPVLMMSGSRPSKVVGFENPPLDCFYKLGHAGGHASGIEMVTLENGAVIHSVHGPLKCEPPDVHYNVYGAKGAMLGRDCSVYYYKEGENYGQGESTTYTPDKVISLEKLNASGINSHGGSDFYPTHCFIEKILGREDGKWSIDVYDAVDMGICGILAYRSILGGNIPISVPNFRNKSERDAYRNDNACTDPKIAGDQLIPSSSYGDKELPDELFEELRRRWENGCIS